MADLVQALQDMADAYRRRPWEPQPTLDRDAVAAMVARHRAGGRVTIADVSACWAAPCRGVPQEPAPAARDARLDAHARALVTDLLRG